MAPLKDPRLVAAIQNALEEGLRFAGYVTWNIETVLLSEDPDDPELHVVNIHPV